MKIRVSNLFYYDTLAVRKQTVDFDAAVFNFF